MVVFLSLSSVCYCLFFVCLEFQIIRTVIRTFTLISSSKFPKFNSLSMIIPITPQALGMAPKDKIFEAYIQLEVGAFYRTEHHEIYFGLYDGSLNFHLSRFFFSSTNFPILPPPPSSNLQTLTAVVSCMRSFCSSRLKMSIPGQRLEGGGAFCSIA